MFLFTKEPVIIEDNSHIHGDIKELLNEGLYQIKGGKHFIKESIKFDRVIGKTYCVETTDNDSIYFEQRKGRKGLSRMVANREPEPCNELTVILIKREDSYQIVTAFIGKSAEPEVWDDRAFKKAINYQSSKQRAIYFWSKHALIKE